jgi:hypothetical protein
MSMALQLGLSADPALRLNINEHGRNLLRVTWSSVVQLNLLASQCESLLFSGVYFYSFYLFCRCLIIRYKEIYTNRILFLAFVSML